MKRHCGTCADTSTELIESAAAADCSCRQHGPDGPYTDARFLHLLEQTFYKDSLPVDGVMHLTASELQSCRSLTSA